MIVEEMRTQLVENMQNTKAKEDETDEANDQWFERNFVDLVQDYPAQWIAVMNQMVICSAATRAGAESRARELAGGKRFSLYFVEPTPLPL